eukprot:TRINITY_DN57147_c0_g1_i1.p1 TRINITY_DN57147_c0_g1~~TRINITY_DN57147_c0_g1_i1.p1  ORF type:complete len:256 (-),score=35.40 TRINITY_DN57147_c0_g1_i1:105-872(-)
MVTWSMLCVAFVFHAFVEQHLSGALAAAAHCCPPVRTIRPFQTREMLGFELRRLGLRGPGVELGAQRGLFTAQVLEGWRQAAWFVMIDVWKPQRNYHDSANVPMRKHLSIMAYARAVADELEKRGRASYVSLCRNTTIRCARLFEDASLDFVYVDARHDRQSVLQDLQTYWPKIREGGVFAGHDYVEQFEVNASRADYTINADGTRDLTGRVVRGAVDDFFSGEALESPEELRRCPRQVVVSYHELKCNTWAVRK